MQQGSAAHHRKRRYRGLVATKAVGQVMYQRDECLVQASVCREKAQADPARYDYWIDQAIVWLQRAIQASRGRATTPELHGARMIPKPLH
jgi:hypothetical protein